MTKGVNHPPRTIMEVYEMLPEGTLAELIDGIIYMSPSPVAIHQIVQGNIFRRLGNHVEETDQGIMIPPPMDVFLDDHSNAVQPDIIFIAKPNLDIIKKKIRGVPDLVGEVISPGNTKHDVERKKNLYERFGVKEYWIIEPESKTATGFHLVNQKFEPLPVSVGKLKSILLGCEISF
ncbi:MAG TPA: Uma2 family endonuclease [Chryseosolibacter sp.]